MAFKMSNSLVLFIRKIATQLWNHKLPGLLNTLNAEYGTLEGGLHIRPACAIANNDIINVNYKNSYAIPLQMSAFICYKSTNLVSVHLWCIW